MEEYMYFGIGIVIALLFVFAFRKPLKARRDAFIESLKKK